MITLQVTEWITTINVVVTIVNCCIIFTAIGTIDKAITLHKFIEQVKRHVAYDVTKENPLL